MNKTLAILFSLVLPLTTLAQSKQDGQPNSLVINNVTVIDATGKPPMPGMTVVIRDGRIATIARGLKAKMAAGTRVIDGSGKYLIPGLWDMHVHEWDKDYFLPLFIVNGITGVRDMFGPLALIKQWREEMKAGTLTGPHIIAAGQIVDGPKPVWPGSIAVSNAEDGVKAVNKVKQDGSDFVKVYSLLPRDGFFAIAAEAKRQGMVFAGHVPVSVTAAEASDAGQKSIEHLTGLFSGCSSKEEELMKASLERKETGLAGFVKSFVEDGAKALESYDDKKAAALFARFKKNGTWMTPTLTVLRAIAYVGDEDFRNDPRMKYVPPFLKYGMWGPTAFGLNIRTPGDNAIAKKLFQKQLEMVGAMNRAGVDILAGTDTPNPYVFPGFSLHDELALLVKAGLTPMQALQAATRNAARYLGMLDSTGTIEQGKLADLVLLDANPLADINSTRKIQAVIVGGRLIDRAALDEMLGKIEAMANAHVQPARATALKKR
ncbi:MAG TPA: amidohydrolase family protein [Blastocatellia bacterium]|nr:amidohydrolase family protein [Blastocatellia bacterium]